MVSRPNMIERVLRVRMRAKAYPASAPMGTETTTVHTDTMMLSS